MTARGRGFLISSRAPLMAGRNHVFAFYPNGSCSPRQYSCLNGAPVRSPSALPARPASMLAYDLVPAHSDGDAGDNNTIHSLLPSDEDAGDNNTQLVAQRRAHGAPSYIRTTACMQERSRCTTRCMFARGYVCCLLPVANQHTNEPHTPAPREYFVFYSSLFVCMARMLKTHPCTLAHAFSRSIGHSSSRFVRENTGCSVGPLQGM